MAANRRLRFAPKVPLNLLVMGFNGETSVSFTLGFDFYAFSLVEEKTGYSLLNGAIFQRMTATNLAVLVWAGLQCYHEEDYAGDEGLTAVKAMLSSRNSIVATAAVQDAYIAQLSDDEQTRIKANVEKVKAKVAKGEDAPAAPLVEKPVDPKAADPTAF
jgi:hypothetical protein